MLTKNQQEFLLLLLKKKLSRHDVNLFDTRAAFSRMAGYLQKNRFIQSEYDGKGMKYYTLTMKGEALALMINTLSDVNIDKIEKEGLSSQS